LCALFAALKKTSGVNFINIFCAFFRTKVLFLTKKSCKNVTFVRKMHEKNGDEIDTRPI
jgi:hypothetical protein